MRKTRSVRRTRTCAYIRSMVTIMLILGVCLAPLTIARADFTVTLKADPEEGGTVTGGGTYPDGTNVDILATPAEGYTFIGWYRYGDTEPFSTSASYTYEQETNRIYVARFEKEVTLQVVAEPAQGGTVTQSGNGNYVFDESVTLTATPSPDYMFLGWFDGSSAATPLSTETTYTYNVHDSMTVIARFSPEYALRVNISPDEGGTVAGNGTVVGGSLVTLEAIPNDNYRFTGWVNDADPSTVLSTDESYSFNLDGDLTLTARFGRSYGFIWTWIATIGGVVAAVVFVVWRVLRKKGLRLQTEPAISGKPKGQKRRWRFNFQNVVDNFKELFSKRRR